jgi:hypothetical protein
VAILRVHDCPSEHLATLVDGRPAPTAARSAQGSHKPHHNSRERALCGERSGRNRDESHRRTICQIAGLDESKRFTEVRQLWQRSPVTPGQSRESRRHLGTAPLDRLSAALEGVSLPRPDAESERDGAARSVGRGQHVLGFNLAGLGGAESG